MTWTLRTFLGKWKPSARTVIACLLKWAGGAAADPGNELLCKCLTGGGESAFDALSAEQKREAEDRFALLQPCLEPHAELIRRLEILANQKASKHPSPNNLAELIGGQLPTDLQPDFHRCLKGLDAVQSWHQQVQRDVLRRFDELDRRPKSPYWLSIDDKADIDWLRAVYEQSRKWSPEQRRQLRPEIFAGLLHNAGLHDAASAACAEAITLTADAVEKSALLHHKMRSDLERLKLDEALIDLRDAITLYPASAPFPAKKYEPLRVLGVGGFGMAVLCRDRYEEHAEIVVKCLHAEGLDRSAQQIFREVPLLRQLAAAHPDLFVNVHYASFADALAERRPFIVMDYFPGVTLTKWLNTQLPEGQGLKLEDFRAIAFRIAKAVHAAHQRGILHRDLKSDNVLVRRDGDRWDVRVIDFGLALRCDIMQKSMSQKAYSRALLGAAAAGTAKYAPPEQMGELNSPVGPYSDVYAFGKTCCEMLFRDLEPKLRHWRSLDDALAELLGKCLERQPGNRHQSFTPILAGLEGQSALFGKIEKSVVLTPSPPTALVCFVCSCGRKLRAPLAKAGKKAKCPSCSQLLFIPTQNTDQPPLVGTNPQAPAFTNSLGMKFALVPRGSFWMGGGGGMFLSTQAKQVEIAYDFYMGVYTVTQGEWRALMGQNPSRFSRGGRGRNKVKKISDADLNQFPVECVSWQAAEQFIAKLNELEPDSGWVYRLPLASEWEYACRGGATSKEDCSYDFYFDTATTDLSSVNANFDGNFPAGNGAKGEFLKRTTKVGSYQPNWLGLYDMHGNVWEWTQWQHEDKVFRELRGGGWPTRGKRCCASVSNGHLLEDQLGGLGFRLARVPVEAFTSQSQIKPVAQQIAKANNEEVEKLSHDALYCYNRGMESLEEEKAIQDFDEAIRLLDKAINLDPNNALAYLQRGKCWLANDCAGSEDDVGNEKMFNDFHEAIRLDPNNSMARVERGLAWFKVGPGNEAFGKAIGDFDEAIRLDPNNAMAYYNRAMALLDPDQFFSEETKAEGCGARDDRIDKVINDLDNAIRLNPSNAEWHKVRGNLHCDRKDYDKAIKDYDSVVQLEPNNSDAYTKCGVTRLLKSDYDQAIQNFGEAIRLDPKKAERYITHAKAWSENGDYDRAIENYSEAIRLDPENAKLYFHRGDAWDAKEDFDKAIRDYDEAIRLNPKVARFYFYRGCGWHSKEDYDNAIRDYDEAIRLDPASAVFFNNRGVAWVAKGEYDKAIEDYSDSIRLEPQNVERYIIRAKAWVRNGEFDKAIEDYDVAIRLSPNVSIYYFMRAKAWDAKGDYDNAIQGFDQAIRVTPNVASYYFMRGRAWAGKGNYGEAIKDYEETIRLDLQNAERFITRVETWAGNGNYDKAIKDYSEAIRLDPQNAEHWYIDRGHAWCAKKEYEKAIQDFNHAIQYREKRLEKLRSLYAPEIFLQNEKQILDRLEDARSKAKKALED